MIIKLEDTSIEKGLSDETLLGGGSTLLGDIGKSINEYKIDNASMEKRQRQEDKVAKQFLDDYWTILYVNNIMKCPFNKIIANAIVTYGEAELLTGIDKQSIKRVAVNIYKHSGEDTTVPLLDVINFAEREEYYNRHRSWQSHVKMFALDYFKSKNFAKFINDSLINYFDMSNEQAIVFEKRLHVTAEYFRMYPPQKDEHDAVQQDTPPAEDFTAAPTPTVKKEQGKRKEGGSNKRTTDRNVTKAACSRLVDSKTLSLDSAGKTGKEEFKKDVEELLNREGHADRYHVTQIEEFFKSSEFPAKYKRCRGKRVKQIILLK